MVATGTSTIIHGEKPRVPWENRGRRDCRRPRDRRSGPMHDFRDSRLILGRVSATLGSQSAVIIRYQVSNPRLGSLYPFTCGATSGTPTTLFPKRRGTVRITNQGSVIVGVDCLPRTFDIRKTYTINCLRPSVSPISVPDRWSLDDPKSPGVEFGREHGPSCREEPS